VEQPSEVRQCAACRIGSLHHTTATYTQWFADDLVLVPGMGAWSCDMCGEFFFDDAELARIEALLGASDTQRSSASVRDIAGSPSLPLSDSPSGHRSD
jgi:YgiT-type zinc finger domain-containing protein